MINDEALNASQVASILHIGRNAVYDLAKSGELPSYRIGRKMLFALKDVEAYLARSRSGDDPFLAVTGVSADSATSEATRDLIHQARTMLTDPGFRTEYARIVHGDAANLGAIVYEC